MQTREYVVGVEKNMAENPVKFPNFSSFSLSFPAPLPVHAKSSSWRLTGSDAERIMDIRSMRSTKPDRPLNLITLSISNFANVYNQSYPPLSLVSSWHRLEHREIAKNWSGLGDSTLHRHVIHSKQKVGQSWSYGY